MTDASDNRDADRTARDLTRAARRSLKARRPARAIAQIEAALTLVPGDFELRLLLGEAHARAKSLDTARAIWETLLAETPDAATRLAVPLRLAQLAEARGDHAAAERLYDAHLAASPDDDAARHRRLSAGIAARPPASRRAFAAAHFARWGESHLGQRIIALSIGLDEDATTAATVLTGDVSAYRADAGLATQAIDALLARGLLDGLLAFTDACRASFPDDARFIDRRIRVLQATGGDDAALLSARGALAAHPAASDSQRLRYARALLSRRRYAEALALARDLLKRSPDNVAVAETAIRAADRLERYDLSHRLLAHGLSRLNDAPRDLVSRAQLLIAASRHADALEALARIPADARDDRVAAMHFTAAYHHGDYRSAADVARPLIAAGAADPQLIARAARVEAALGIVAQSGALFPDALFAHALSRPGNGANTADDTIAIATSTLAAGGAERQAALTAAHAAQARARAGDRRTILIARSLDPTRRHDVMLPFARTEELEIDDLSTLDPAAVWRELTETGAPADDLALIAAFPETIATDIATLYLRFRQARPRVIHLWQDGRIAIGSVAAVLAGVPRIVAAIRNVLPAADDRRRYRRYLPVMYAALARRDDVRFTTNSHAATTDYAAMLNLPPSRIAVVHNGLDTAALRRRATDEAIAAVRAELGFGDAPVMGGVFRLAPAKRPELWIRTAALVARTLPHARFVIVGDGVLRAALEGLVAEHGLSHRLVFAGQRAPVEPWIAAMDAFLLTSSVEGLPNVLLEAQALGVPVVTTDAGGARETTVDGVTGRLVRDDTPENLGAAAIALLQRASAKMKCRVAGPAFVESRFGVGRMIKDTLRLYGAP